MRMPPQVKPRRKMSNSCFFLSRALMSCGQLSQVSPDATAVVRDCSWTYGLEFRYETVGPATCRRSDNKPRPNEPSIFNPTRAESCKHRTLKTNGGKSHGRCSGEGMKIENLHAGKSRPKVFTFGPHGCLRFGGASTWCSCQFLHVILVPGPCSSFL